MPSSIGATVLSAKRLNSSHAGCAAKAALPGFGALALAPDGKRLYVADAGENCVAAVDVSKPGRSRVLGFVPTEPLVEVGL